MELELDDIQTELAATLNRVLADTYDMEARDRILASPEPFDQAAWDRFAELGLLGLAIPEEHDGAGMTFAEIAVVMEEFGRALVLEPYLPTVVLGAGLVAELASPEVAAAVLPGVAEGTLRLAFAGFEPGARYDLDRPETVAEAAPASPSPAVVEVAGSKPATHVLSGEKTAVLGAGVAHGLLVTAAIASEAGTELGVFLVDADSVLIDRRTQADGAGSGAVRLEHTPAVLLGGGAASDAVHKAIDTANAALMAEAVGAMSTALTMTADYLRTRVQFGVPIGKNQALAHRAADMYASLESARSMALYAKLAILGEAAGHMDAQARHRDVLAAKLVIDEAARHIGQEAIQMHGGIGMTMEYPLGHYAKRLEVITRTFDDADGVRADLAAAGGLVDAEAADL